MKRPDPSRSLALAFVPWIIAAFFIVPVTLGVLATALPAFGWIPGTTSHAFSLEAWRDFFLWPGLRSSLVATLVSGWLASLTAFLISLLIMASLAESRGMKHLRRWLSGLLSLPHAAFAVGLAFLIAPSGLMMRAFSPWLTGLDHPPDWPIVGDPLGISLALGLLLKEIPYLLFMLMAALNQVNVEERMRQARAMGYSPASAWLKTVFPALYPQIRLPVFAVMTFSLSSIDMALILGPNNPSTLAVESFRWFLDPDPEFRALGAAAALVQAVIVLASLTIWWGLEFPLAWLGRVSAEAGGRGRLFQQFIRPFKSGFAVLLLLYGATLTTLALWSFARTWRFPDALPSRWTFANWQRDFSGLSEALLNSLTVGLASAGLAFCLVVLALENENLRRRVMRPATLLLIYAPLIVPQNAFLLGNQLLLAFFRLDGYWLSLVFAHLLFVLPYVFLSLQEPWRALDPAYGRFAASLGALPLRNFFVRLTLLTRPLLFAAALGFSVSIALYLPTIIAGAGRWPTLTSEAVSLASGSNRRLLAIMAFLQSLLPLVAFGLALGLPPLLFRHRRGMQP